MLIQKENKKQYQAIYMNSKTSFINPEGLFDPSNNGFSHVGMAVSASPVVFISGQWASDTLQNLVAEDFSSQVVQTISNLKTALGSIQLTEKNIVKLTIYIVDFTRQKKIQLLRAAAPLFNLDEYPASTIVPVPVLATHPKSLIEIEAIAVK